MTENHVDVLIVGAGISGIGAACHLTRDGQGQSYLILERRHSIGGTWDLFRYPGIRSDSDMSTFGFNFRPWTDSKVLADGPPSAPTSRRPREEYRVLDQIRFGQYVQDASWSSATGLWTVRSRNDETGETGHVHLPVPARLHRLLQLRRRLPPRVPGREQFTGPIIHPQHWPEDLDYTGKKVVVIGSGATAVTLVPAMAPTPRT